MQINLSSVFIEIENFLFQLLFFLVLFPKTLIKGIINPKWIHNYITEELKKEQKEQFKEYMNPLYFFIAVYVIVNIAASTILKNITESDLHVFSAQGLTTSSIIFLLLPIPFAIALIKIAKKSVNNTEYRRAYYMQLIIFGIGLTLFILIGLLMIPLLKEEITGTSEPFVPKTLSLIATLIALPVFAVWFFATQTIVFYNEILFTQAAEGNKSKNWAKAVLFVILCLIIDIVLWANSNLIDNTVNTVIKSLGF